MATVFYILQNKESEDATVACRVITDDEAQIILLPGQWTKVATLEPGSHVLRVGAILASGTKNIKFKLKGALFNGDDNIEDLFYSPTDGSIYNIEVSK